MALLTCPHCRELTVSTRRHCMHCDVRLPDDFGVLRQPDPSDHRNPLVTPADKSSSPPPAPVAKPKGG
jgi:hypothetical protein